MDASELEYFEIPLIDPRYPPANTLDNSENDPNSVQLADKRAVRCIDRLKLPQFARDFYNTLERESKPANLSGLGRDGVLIDPSQSSATQAFSDGNAYVIRFSFPSEYELRSSGFRFSDYLEYIKNCVGNHFHTGMEISLIPLEVKRNLLSCHMIILQFSKQYVMRQNDFPPLFLCSFFVQAPLSCGKLHQNHGAKYQSAAHKLSCA